MAINEDCVMVVLEFPGGGTPIGWTLFQNDGLIARRVTYAQVDKLQLIGRKAVACFVYQENAGGSQAFATEYAGNDSYAFQYDATHDSVLVSKYNASGGGAGTTRNNHNKGSGGVESEFWEKAQGQVPMLGSVIQDAGPNGALLASAQAIDPATVPLG